MQPDFFGVTLFIPGATGRTKRMKQGFTTISVSVVAAHGTIFGMKAILYRGGMGVKTRYLYHSGSSLYLGPLAYYRLVSLYEHYAAARTLTKMVPLQTLLPATGGWRKKILPVYKELKRIVGTSVGELRVLKMRCPKRNPDFVAYKQYVLEHPKPKTPPTTRPVYDGN
jgi:hypothetical protein